ncbi:o-succinylbenzoate synthase [Halobacteriaceae archaeon GCM10025711]
MIDAVSLRPFSLPLRQPLATARGTIDRRDGFLLQVEADGHVGFGEATPLPGWTESLADCRNALDAATDALAADGFAAALAATDGSPAARHAVSLARSDLDARRDDVPLYRRLGGDETSAVPVNATVGDGDVEATAHAAAEAVADGFHAVKVKVGARSVADDVRRVRAVRDRVGTGVELRADANGAWSREDARNAFDAFEDAGVAFVEQPLPATDLDGLASLRGGSVGVALDETLAAVSVEDALDAGAGDAFVLKPMALGGPDRARDVARTVREAGFDVLVTTTVDAVVARTGAVHLAASLGDLPASGLATASLLGTDLGPDPAPVVGGEARVPQNAGLGVAEVSVDA